MDNRTNVDVMDRSGRAKQLVLAAMLGIVAAFVTFLVTKQLAAPDTLPHSGVGMQSRSFYNAWAFIYFTTALAGAVVFSLALAVTRRRR